jgi:hypothetical protein
VSTKPTQVPEWATDETNNTEPSAGQKATGYTPGQAAVSSYFNWFMRRAGQWCQYLNDGALEGPISITTALQVTAGAGTGVVQAAGGFLGGQVKSGQWWTGQIRPVALQDGPVYREAV